jgi:hypothetical protein
VAIQCTGGEPIGWHTRCCVAATSAGRWQCCWFLDIGCRLGRVGRAHQMGLKTDWAGRNEKQKVIKGWAVRG